jgi:hypothetical protein
LSAKEHGCSRTSWFRARWLVAQLAAAHGTVLSVAETRRAGFEFELA